MADIIIYVTRAKEISQQSWLYSALELVWADTLIRVVITLKY
jgi:hypothetical protein